LERLEGQKDDGCSLRLTPRKATLQSDEAGITDLAGFHNPALKRGGAGLLDGLKVSSRNFSCLPIQNLLFSIEVTKWWLRMSRDGGTQLACDGEACDQKCDVELEEVQLCSICEVLSSQTIVRCPSAAAENDNQGSHASAFIVSELNVASAQTDSSFQYRDCCMPSRRTLTESLALKSVMTDSFDL
jgi:hypothetical protein